MQLSAMQSHAIPCNIASNGEVSPPTPVFKTVTLTNKSSDPKKVKSAPGTKNKTRVINTHKRSDAWAVKFEASSPSQLLIRIMIFVQKPLLTQFHPRQKDKIPQNNADFQCLPPTTHRWSILGNPNRLVFVVCFCFLSKTHIFCVLCA